MLNNKKILGVIPSRMGSSRFPGKPLEQICSIPMLEHIFLRSKECLLLDNLIIATCDKEIKEFCEQKGYDYVMTSSDHTRAMDRVYEAAKILNVNNDDIVVNIQGDEPLVKSDIIGGLISEFSNPDINAALLAIPIKEKSIFENPDTVKVVITQDGFMAYSSRAEIPFQKDKSTLEDAYRIAGMFAFKFRDLKLFNGLGETPLEIIESCDVNRMIDHNLRIKVHINNIENYFSVDSPEDIGKVEEIMINDKLFKTYKGL